MGYGRTYGNSSGGAAFLCVIGVLGVVGLAVGIGITQFNFNRRCAGFLKNASDANSIPQAISRLEMAKKYLDDNKLTSGDSSIYFTSPQSDVGFWYNNIVTALNDLKANEEATPLERSNVLIKLRETLLDNGQVTLPVNMALFPSQVGWTVWMVLSACLAFFSGVYYRLTED